eukprot:Pgem_evm2s6417
MPPMLQKGVQMNSESHKQTIRIASARIDVERVIARAKRFAIIGGEVDMNIMLIINEVSKICFYLVNFQNRCVNEGLVPRD